MRKRKSELDKFKLRFEFHQTFRSIRKKLAERRKKRGVVKKRINKVKD